MDSFTLDFPGKNYVFLESSQVTVGNSTILRFYSGFPGGKTSSCLQRCSMEIPQDRVTKITQPIGVLLVTFDTVLRVAAGVSLCNTDPIRARAQNIAINPFSDQTHADC